MTEGDRQRTQCARLGNSMCLTDNTCWREMGMIYSSSTGTGGATITSSISTIGISCSKHIGSGCLGVCRFPADFLGTPNPTYMFVT
mmetsp:Transcript_10656/g.12949  ORF Transcript_10656/g.12949 Transcript_10656/m.12949 type:complete len:86 (-) Transcript_10656:483-740(-)